MRKLSDILYKITGAINVVLITLIIVLTFLQVLLRYITHISMPWAQELTVYAMVWMVFFGCSMGMRKHEVASLTLLEQALPYRGKQILTIINNAILITFLVIIFKANIAVIENAMNRLSGMMRIPTGYVNIALSVMAVLVILYGLIDVYDAVMNLINYKKEADEE